MKKLIRLESRLSGIMFLSAILMMLNSCSKESDMSSSTGSVIPYQSPKYEIFAGDYTFTPYELNVPVDSPVVWTNSGHYRGYTITCDSAHFSATLGHGQSVSYRFSTPGRFEYVSNYPGMNGYVIVY